MAVAQRRGRGGSALSALIAAGFVGASLSFVVGSSAPRLQRLAARATVTDVEVEPTKPTTNPAVQDAKDRLMDLLEDSSLEEEVLRPEGRPMRGRVDEAIVTLERLNTNEEPVYSVDLDGTWVVKYTGRALAGQHNWTSNYERMC